MSQDWYLMKPPNQQYSGYETDYLNDYGLDSFSELLETMIGEDVVIYDSTMTESENVRVIINDKTNNVTLKNYEVSLLFPLSINCKVGMYVQYKNDYWLVTSYTNDNLVYQKVIMQLCNYTLPFQSPDGTILSYPCIDETTSTLGIDEGSVITTGSGIHRIKLPFDSNTELLREDKRVFLDKRTVNPTPYKITKVNTTEYVGLIELTLEQDEINLTTDNIDVKICNYFEPINQPTPEPSSTGNTLSIQSSGDFYIGKTRMLTPTLKDSEGNVLDNWVAIWSINYNDMNQDYFTIEYIDNQCKVTISKDAYDCVDEILEFTCTVDGEDTSIVYNQIIMA